MAWIPSEKEKQYLTLVLSMTTDCLLKRGTETMYTYVTNLEMISKQLKEITKKKEIIPIPGSMNIC